MGDQGGRCEGPRDRAIDGDEKGDRSSLRDGSPLTSGRCPPVAPADLVIGTTSDQQRQVREKLDLFNRSLGSRRSWCSSRWWGSGNGVRSPDGVVDSDHAGDDV